MTTYFQKIESNDLFVTFQQTSIEEAYGVVFTDTQLDEKYGSRIKSTNEQVQVPTSTGTRSERRSVYVYFIGHDFAAKVATELKNRKRYYPFSFSSAYFTDKYDVESLNKTLKQDHGIRFSFTHQRFEKATSYGKKPAVKPIAFKHHRCFVVEFFCKKAHPDMQVKLQIDNKKELHRAVRWLKEHEFVPTNETITEAHNEFVKDHHWYKHMFEKTEGADAQLVEWWNAVPEKEEETTEEDVESNDD